MNEGEFIECPNCNFPAYRIRGRGTYNCQKCKSTFIDEEVGGSKESVDFVKNDFSTISNKNDLNHKKTYSGVTIATILAIIVLAVVIIKCLSDNDPTSNNASTEKDPYATKNENANYDSMVRTESAVYQRHADSVQTENTRIADSFHKTPIGKAQFAKELKEKRAVELKDKLEREKEEKEHKKYQKVMDKLGCSEDEARDILDRKIWLGMTYEMVVYERGKPNVVNISNYGYGDEYQACWEDYTPSCFYFKESDHIITAYN